MGIYFSKELRRGVLEKEDKEYPKLLKEISDCPDTLFWRGNFKEEIFQNTLAVVGSRRMTNYGKRVVDEIITTVSNRGITIVSGFMYGIDALAHQSALFSKGKTIAVMPCGADVIHPSYQKDLYKKIEREGLIISEYEDGFPPDKWTYPKRNRIVAGLSMAVLIVEAAENSGSLITANLALKYKRKLFAVPGSIFSPVSKGTNMLIKEGLAESVLTSKEILSFFEKGEIDDSCQKGKDGKALSKREILGLGKDENKIISFLIKEELTLDELIEKTKMPASKTRAILSILELKEVIKEEGLRYRVK